MPKRSSTKHQGPEDINEVAFRVFQASIGQRPIVEESQKNSAAVELGRLGGRVGGKARAEKLTPEQRTAIARQAAQTRWAKKENPSD